MLNFSKLALLGTALAISAPFAAAIPIPGGTIYYANTPYGSVNYTGTTSALQVNMTGTGTPGPAGTGGFSGILAPTMATLAGDQVTLDSFNTATLSATPIFSLTDNGLTVTFAANSAVVTFDTNNFADVLLTGVFTETGYTATNGTLFFSTQGSANTSTSFSATGNVPSTPEPNSLILLGTGLVSTAGMLLRRRRIVA